MIFFSKIIIMTALAICFLISVPAVYGMDDDNEWDRFNWGMLTLDSSEEEKIAPRRVKINFEEIFETQKPGYTSWKKDLLEAKDRKRIEALFSHSETYIGFKLNEAQYESCFDDDGEHRREFIKALEWKITHDESKAQRDAE